MSEPKTPTPRTKEITHTYEYYNDGEYRSFYYCFPSDVEKLELETIQLRRELEHKKIASYYETYCEIVKERDQLLAQYNELHSELQTAQETIRVINEILTHQSLL